jgi:putative acetyltransferase
MITHANPTSQQVISSSAIHQLPSYDTATAHKETPIAIRYAEPDDINYLHELLIHPMTVYWTSELPCTTTEQVYQRFVQSSECCHTLVATSAHQIVGMLGLHMNPHPRVRHVARISPVIVHANHQGKGIGSALVKAAIDLADQWFNLHRLELMVYTDNEAAIALYTKFGFVAEGIMQHYAFRAGQYADIQIMARLSHH